MLGLPIEYKKHPHYFDAHNVSEDTPRKNAIIERHLHSHNAKTVLDLTCGTGSQVFFLLERGYQAIGSDFSPALLEIARKKAHHHHNPLCAKATFIDGDMRTLHAGQFDAVITIFNAIGHLTKKGFEKALRNVHRNLKDGGIYIFDIFNLAEMTDSAVEALKMDIHRVVEGVDIHNTQTSTLDRETGRLTSYDHYTIGKKVLKNRFSLQLYTPEELQDMLHKTGFETVIQTNEINLLTVARKR